MTRIEPARLVLVGIAAAVFTVDQVTKWMAVHLVDDRAVAWGPVSLAVSRNTGGPFGVAPSMPAAWLAVAVFGASVAAWAVVRVDRVDAVTVTVAIVAGGVLGNLADRLARGRGGGAAGVVDWIAVAPYPFAFNLADVALRGGAVALVAAVAGRTAAAADGTVPRPESAPASRSARPCTVDGERGH